MLSATLPRRDHLGFEGIENSGFNGDAPRPQTMSKSHPHICFVAPEAWPVFSRNTDIQVVGGAEVQQSILARLFVRAGYKVSMICLDYGQPQRVELDGIEVHRAHRPDDGIPGLRFFYPRLTSLWKTMRAVDADIYYQRSAGMLTAVVAGFCRWHGKRSIYAGAADPDFLPGQQEVPYRRDRWLFERGLAIADRLVVQNLTQKSNCQTHYGRVAALIPSCYELPINARPGSGAIVLWVATLHKRKQPHLFLDLAERLPKLRFVMIGGPTGGATDDPSFEAIRARASALPNVEFKGFLPLSQVEPYFDQAHVFVNTALYEGMPNTFLQSWARGIPTVAFIDTGARLRDEPVCRIVYDVDDAAEEIDRLFRDASYWRRVSSRCREYFAATHSPDGVLARYRHLIDELAQETN